MALPPGITPKTVTVGVASFFDGALAEGTATITAPVNVVHNPSNRPIFSSRMVKRFVDGEASFDLTPTDAAGLNRVDWTYRLNVVIQGALVQPDPIYFTLPESGPDVIDLDALVPVPSSAGTPVSVAVLTAEDLDGYTAQYLGDPTSATSGAARAAFGPPILRQISDPQFRGVPRVMATPPTVTVTNNTSSPTMTGTRTLPGQSYTSIVCDDLTKYRPLGVGTSLPVRGGGGGINGFACGWAPTQYGTEAIRLEWLFDGAEFEVGLRQFTGNQFRIMIDGQYVTQYPQTLGGTPGQFGTVKVTLGSRAVRRVVFEIKAVGHVFLGVWMGVNDTMRATAAPKRRLLVGGDSYTSGSGSSTAIASWPYYYGQALGFRDIVNSGLGSSGWFAAGAEGVKLGARLATDVIAPAPTDVVIAMGHNDTPFANAAIQAEVASVLAAIRAGLPNLQSLVVIGPLFAGGAPGVYTAMGAAIQAGCAASGATYIDTTTAPIFTGTGRVGATVGDGNSDLYIGADGTHPTDAGSEWLGHVLAQSVAAALS